MKSVNKEKILKGHILTLIIMAKGQEMFQARNTYMLIGFLQGDKKCVSEECKFHTQNVLRSICLKHWVLHHSWKQHPHGQTSLIIPTGKTSSLLKKNLLI